MRKKNPVLTAAGKKLDTTVDLTNYSECTSETGAG